MFGHVCSLSVGLSLLFRTPSALSLEVGNIDSIKSLAQTLAGPVIDTYKDQPRGPSPAIWTNKNTWSELGPIWGALVEYSYLTGDWQFDSATAKALWTLNSLYEWFETPSKSQNVTNGAQSNWALAALTAAEVGFSKPGEGAWIDLAKKRLRTWPASGKVAHVNVAVV